MRVYGPLKIIVLILSAIAAFGLSIELIRTLFSIKNAISHPGLIFIAGALTFAVISQFASLPSAVYVFGHELTHALAVILSGGKVTSFKVRASGGMVTTTVSSSFIALAPYFFPVYTVIVIVIYNCIEIFVPLAGVRTLYFYLLGLTYGFHLGCTAAYTRSYQPDLREEGLAFSTVMIYFANLIVLTFVLKLLFTRLDLAALYAGAGERILSGALGIARWVSMTR